MEYRTQAINQWKTPGSKTYITDRENDVCMVIIMSQSGVPKINSAQILFNFTQ